MKFSEFERFFLITFGCALMLWYVGFSNAYANTEPPGDYYICSKIYHTENLDPTYVCLVNGALKQIVDTQRECYSDVSTGVIDFGDSICPKNVGGR